MFNNLVKMYVIPDNVRYIQYIDEIQSWQETSAYLIDKPVVFLFIESKGLRSPIFLVYYKGQIQTRGGGGTCYNPSYKYHSTYVTESIGKYWSKDRIFSTQYIWQTICHIKYELLQKMEYKEYLPCWYWNCKDHIDGMYGLLAGKLDLIGMGKASCDIITEGRKSQKLLQFGIYQNT